MASDAADPLSFFAAGSDDSSDSEEDERSTEELKPEKIEPVNPPTKRLPPPMVALAGAKRPEFTINPLNEGMDWDKLVKKAPEVPEKEYKPWVHSLPSVDRSVKTKYGEREMTLAQQVPGGIVPTTGLVGRPIECIDQAISWSNMYKTMDKDGTVKRVRPEDIGGEEGFCFTDVDSQRAAFSMKRHKGQNQPTGFRSKEARKRTLGQSNREKMFVEDEKRTLRQNLEGNY